MKAEEIFEAAIKESIKSLIGGGLSNSKPAAATLVIRADVVAGLPESIRTANDGILVLNMDPQKFKALFVGESHFEVLVSFQRQRMAIGVPYHAVLSFRDAASGLSYSKPIIPPKAKDQPLEIKKEQVDVEESSNDRKILPFRPRSARAPEPAAEDPGGDGSSCA